MILIEIGIGFSIMLGAIIITLFLSFIIKAVIKEFYNEDIDFDFSIILVFLFYFLIGMSWAIGTIVMGEA
jgi:hypothetical protein